MGEIICRALEHVSVVEYSVVVYPARSTSNIICDAAHVVTHNKSSQQVLLFVATAVHCIFCLRFVGEWI